MTPKHRWPRALLLHHLALALILGIGIFVVGTPAVWTSDEGALLAQIEHRNASGEWEMAHPVPEVDQSGTYFPLTLASYGTDGGYVALGKHTAYLQLSRAAFAVGGYRAVVAVSTMSTLAAASAACFLARRFDRRAGTIALWFAGLGTPLAFNAYVAWAHSLGAALIGWALVGLFASEPPQTKRNLLAGSAPRLAWALGAVALLIACLVRTEAVLAAGAIVAALVLRGFYQQRRRPSLSASLSAWSSALLPALLAGAATAAGFVIDRATAVATRGAVDPVPFVDAWGGLPGRIDALLRTWLYPGTNGGTIDLLLPLSVIFVMVAAVTATRASGPSRRTVGALTAAAALFTSWALFGHQGLIPGLFVACPLLIGGLLARNHGDYRLVDPQESLAQGLALFLAVFFSLVVATQYRAGGGAEWGGRYFALGLPALTAVTVPPLLRRFEELRQSDRRLANLALAMCVLLAVGPTAIGLRHLHQTRESTQRFLAMVAATAESLDTDDKPLIISTAPHAARWGWVDLGRFRWLTVTETSQLEELWNDLGTIGIDSAVVLVDHRLAHNDAATDLDQTPTDVDLAFSAFGAGFNCDRDKPTTGARPGTDFGIDIVVVERNANCSNTP